LEEERRERLKAFWLPPRIYLETTHHNLKQQYPCWWGRNRRVRDGTTWNNNRADDIDSYSKDGDGFRFYAKELEEERRERLKAFWAM